MDIVSAVGQWAAPIETFLLFIENNNFILANTDAVRFDQRRTSPPTRPPFILSAFVLRILRFEFSESSWSEFSAQSYWSVLCKSSKTEMFGENCLVNVVRRESRSILAILFVKSKWNANSATGWCLPTHNSTNGTAHMANPTLTTTNCFSSSWLFCTARPIAQKEPQIHMQIIIGSCYYHCCCLLFCHLEAPNKSTINYLSLLDRAALRRRRRARLSLVHCTHFNGRTN